MAKKKVIHSPENIVIADAIIQRYIVHLIRNSVKYIPSKKRKDFCNHLRLIYKAPNKKVALIEFEKFKNSWSKDYPGAVTVWERNWKPVEQLYDYTAPIRRIMYTTNAIESANASFRKVIKKGVFPNDDAVLKVMYLRGLELYDKWLDRPLSSWTDVRNQLKAAGSKIVFKDYYSGATLDRPQFNELRKALEAGDTLMITKLDRLARSATQGIKLIDELLSHGIKVHVLNMGLMDNTPTGKLIRTILLAFAEFERDMIIERTKEGRKFGKYNLQGNTKK